MMSQEDYERYLAHAQRNTSPEERAAHDAICRGITVRMSKSEILAMRNARPASVPTGCNESFAPQQHSSKILASLARGWRRFRGWWR